jgi:glutaredoxin-related protein
MTKVFVMASCPDCVQVKALLRDNPNYELIDIGENARSLKQFLAYRDTHPAFQRVKERGNIGIPCFVFEDGSIEFKMKHDKTESTREGASCSLDGNGC